MKEGDVLYKIDGRLVKVMNYQEIMRMMNGRPTVFIFEKKVEQMIHCQVSIPVPISASVPVSVPVPVPVSVPMQQCLRPRSDEVNVQQYVKAVAPPIPSAIVTPTIASTHDKRSPPGQVSTTENNLLASIFLPNDLDADDSMLSEYTLYQNANGDRCPNLVAIPEGTSTDTSNDTSNEMECSTDDSGEGNGDEVASAPQHRINEFTLASPTFSYSVTTVNDSTCPTSPLGAGIPTTLSIMTLQMHNEDCVTDVISPRQQFHDSQVMKLRQKYAPYLSPDSEYNMPTSTVMRMKEASRLKDDFPCQTVERVASMESCSVSTVFMSPKQASRAPASSSLVPLYSNSNFNSNTPVTNRSQVSEAMSYNDIPISMLDYKYVRECDSFKKLEMIISALRATSPPEFPSLLRMAEHRLIDLRGKDHQQVVEEEALDVYNEAHCDGLDDAGRRNGVPSHIHVEMQTNMQSELHADDYIHEHAHARGEDDDDGCDNDVAQDENDGMEEDMNDIVMAHAELQGQMEELLQERDAMQENLTSQVQTLEDLLGNVKTEMQKQTNESNGKIEFLKKAKVEAELQMNKLREACVSSSMGVEQMKNDLKAKEEEIGRLAAQLYKEQESKRVAVERTECVQERLRGQVESLTNQLRVQVKRTEVSRTMVELQLRSEYDAKLQKDNEVMIELERKLISTVEDAQALYQENQLMATEFARVGMVSTCYSEVLNDSFY